MTDAVTQAVDTPAPDAPVAPVEEQVVQTEAESSPATTDAGEQTETEAKKPHWSVKRIDELTRNWREAERREAALMAMLQRQQTPAQPEAAKEAPKAPPKLEDFNYDESAYQAALFQHVKDEAAKVAREELQQERTREKEQAKKQTFKQRETDFAKANPDYIELTRDPSLPLTRDVIELATESEQGAEILYYLAKNREIAERIAELPPVAAAREIGRIEAKLEKPLAPQAPSVPKAPPVSKAPPPPPRIEAVEQSSPIRPDSADSDKLSDAEWMRLRNKQVARKKG